MTDYEHLISKSDEQFNRDLINKKKSPSDADYTHLVDDFAYKCLGNARLKLKLKTRCIEFHELSTIKSADKRKSFYQLAKALELNDVSGVFIEKASSPYDTNAYLVVNSYPRLSDTDPASKRQKTSIELAYGALRTAQDNYKHLTKWHAKISDLINKYYDKSSRLESTERKKKYLVFINPHSGSGRASQLFLNHIVPVFVESQTSHEIILTGKFSSAIERDYYHNCSSLKSSFKMFPL